MKKYRHHAFCIFFGTNDEEYMLDIPSPYLCDTEDEALKMGEFAPRFVKLKEFDTPFLMLFDDEEFEAGVMDDGTKCLYGHTVGDVYVAWNFDDFTKNGGAIRIRTEESKGNVITYDEDYVATNHTFSDCFPMMKENKPYYVDYEAYKIEIVEV